MYSNQYPTSKHENTTVCLDAAVLKCCGRWKTNMKWYKLFNCYNVINLQQPQRMQFTFYYKGFTAAYNKGATAIFGVITLEC